MNLLASWPFWLGLGLALFLVEFKALRLVTGAFAVLALAMAALAWLGQSLPLQLSWFAAAGLAGLAMVRSVALGALAVAGLIALGAIYTLPRELAWLLAAGLIALVRLKDGGKRRW